MTHNKLKKIALSKSKVKTEYDALEPSLLYFVKFFLLVKKPV